MWEASEKADKFVGLGEILAFVRHDGSPFPRMFLSIPRGKRQQIGFFTSAQPHRGMESRQRRRPQKLMTFLFLFLSFTALISYAMFEDKHLILVRLDLD